MQLEERVEVLVQLGNEITREFDNEWINSIADKSYRQNPWFTVENAKQALNAISEKFLTRENLEIVKAKYFLNSFADLKSIGLVLAGNIPAVGFHDVLCVFLTGQKSLIKISSKDDVIIPALIQKMIEINPAAEPYFEFAERMKGIDAVIATGGNNTSRYFEYYFRDVPHLIRKSRSSVAVLTGDESREDLIKLGKDIFSYFGLGCRNVSKLMIPKDYDLKILLEVLDEYEEIAHHNKYKNNFDYSLALYLLNKDPVLANNCIILRNDPRVSSRIACLHYQFYMSDQDLFDMLSTDRDTIQCIISKNKIKDLEVFDFGQAQNPGILDFADGVDTIKFLMELNDQTK